MCRVLVCEGIIGAVILLAVILSRNWDVFTWIIFIASITLILHSFMYRNCPICKNGVFCECTIKESRSKSRKKG